MNTLTPPRPDGHPVNHAAPVVRMEAIVLTAAWAVTVFNAKLIARAGTCFVAGVIIFSGSLYILALTGIKMFGAITPIGGLLLMAGWMFMILGTIKKG